MTTNTLIENNICLADKIAFYKRKSLPKYISFDEIQSAAHFGLVQAARKYDPSCGDFKAYASFRIFGEIKDYLRSLYWGGRNQNIKMSSWDDKYEQVERIEKEDFFEDIIKNITPIGKKIMRLYYVDGFSIKKIAGEVGLSTTRIFQLLKSNLQILREQKYAA